MTQSEMRFANMLGRIMLAVGALGTVVTVVLRVWLSPGVINSSNGMLDAPWLVMGFMLLCLVGMFVLGLMVGGFRRETVGGPSVALAMSLLAAGALLLYGEGETLWLTLNNEIPVLQIIQGVLGVLSALAFVVLAFRLLSEGASRRGIAQWIMLLPVLWMWFRMVNYEMSYDSLVRIEDAFFGFAMLILELLFLFKFARYIAGIGVVRTGFMLFYSLSTALFALSSVAVKVIFFYMNDGLAMDAYGIATVGDLAVGVLAVAFAVTQLFSQEQIQSEEFELPEEESAGKDLILSSNEDEESGESDLITE